MAIRLPAQDLARVRDLYSKKLGPEPSEQRPAGCSTGAALVVVWFVRVRWTVAGQVRQMGWDVEDIEATVSRSEEALLL